jgi:hypothetical protein
MATHAITTRKAIGNTTLIFCTCGWNKHLAREPITIGNAILEHLAFANREREEREEKGLHWPQ